MLLSCAARREMVGTMAAVSTKCTISSLKG